MWVCVGVGLGGGTWRAGLQPSANRVPLRLTLRARPSQDGTLLLQSTAAKRGTTLAAPAYVGLVGLFAPDSPHTATVEAAGEALAWRVDVATLREHLLLRCPTVLLRLCAALHSEALLLAEAVGAPTHEERGQQVRSAFVVCGPWQCEGLTQAGRWQGCDRMCECKRFACILSCNDCAGLTLLLPSPRSAHSASLQHLAILSALQRLVADLKAEFERLKAAVADMKREEEGEAVGMEPVGTELRQVDVESQGLLNMLLYDCFPADSDGNAL